MFILTRESSERNSHIGVISNESTIKISEPEEKLDLLDFSWGRPIANDLNFQFVHLETVRADDKAKEIRRLDVEFAPLDFRVEIIVAESAQDFADVGVVFGNVI